VKPDPKLAPSSSKKSFRSAAGEEKVAEVQKEMQPVFKPADLNYNQKAINFLFQFLNQVCLLDDKITAK
jgi:hypothetical protein